MYKLGKLYSNLWIRVADEDFDKLLQIQQDYGLQSVEEVLELLVNAQTIDRLAKESNEYTSEKDSKLRSQAS